MSAGKLRDCLSSITAVALVANLLATVASAQATSAPQSDGTAPSSSPQTPPSAPTFASVVTVVGTTPLPGLEVPITTIPSPVQTATDHDVRQAGALDMSDFLNKRLTSVHVNGNQGNPFQSDLSYRGYTASPLLGTPQGISVYMDGVRLNQPFGDVVSWDLIPRLAVGSIALMPGSNPLFGLNTLGGALAIHTKDGLHNPGTSVQAIFGSNTRRGIEFEHGGFKPGGLQWYMAGNLFGDDGWREGSPSTVRQIFGKLSQQQTTTDISMTLAYANNELTGNGLQDERLLERDYHSIYTKPDHTNNRSTSANLLVRRRLRDTLSVSANAYYRHFDTDTLNGDANEESLGQALYQPNAAERAALAAGGYTGVPASGASAANTPFPSWRCIANVLLQDEPAAQCNGLLNRGDSRQQNAGVSGQVTLLNALRGGTSQLTAGASYDWNGTDFLQSTELGYLNPDRSVTGVGAFADGVTGGELDGEPFDTAVNLNGRSHTASIYATDSLTFRSKWHVTIGGRFNQTRLRNRDRLAPDGTVGSLNGDHTFSRFNPSAGLTIDLRKDLNVYGSYNEASRAPTSIELGCADPEQPCRLPNAMASDPPLSQVVARTWEGGLRGGDRLRWSAGFFRASNDDDILFVASEQTGFGYFRNFGNTRRRGIEVNASGRFGRITAGSGYTFLDATYQSEETVNGDGNSTNDAAAAGIPGIEGSIDIEPGDQIPQVPRHMLKVFADVDAGKGLSIGLNVIAQSRSFARGNENNDHQPDGQYYLGRGVADGYGVLNLGVRQRLRSNLELFAQIDNVFDRQYVTAAQLGASALTPSGNFIARPFPAIGGEFPLQRVALLAPGAPRIAWVGLRLTMGR